jgi:deoxyhypusine synthase
MGKWLTTNGKKDNSLVKLAYEHDVPIFCPAFTDSSAGFGLVKHQVDAMKAGEPYHDAGQHRRLPRADRHQDRGGHHRPADDRRRRAEELHPGHRRLRRDPRPRRRRGPQICVQITVADVRDGACSSSTLQEAASWGKVSTRIEQMVFAEGDQRPSRLLASDALALRAPGRQPRKSVASPGCSTRVSQGRPGCTLGARWPWGGPI